MRTADGDEWPYGSNTNDLITARPSTLPTVADATDPTPMMETALSSNITTTHESTCIDQPGAVAKELGYKYV